MTSPLRPPVTRTLMSSSGSKRVAGAKHFSSRTSLTGAQFPIPRT